MRRRRRRRQDQTAAALAALRQARIDAICREWSPSPELVRAVREARAEIDGWRGMLAREGHDGR